MSVAKTETPRQREQRLKVLRRAAKKYRDKTVEQRRVYMMAWRYGLTVEDWDKLFTSQGRCCAICRGAEPDRRRGWAVDHDHRTGRVRGILCSTCNLVLGMFKDSADRHDAASAYLRANTSD